jgi:4-alpha-glucanotransferase
MGLHRLYCIPDGADKLDGVYVRYPWEEYYAILALESHRHQAMIVGEDLGIVPHQVRSAMARHGLARTWVLQFELMASGAAGLHDPPAGSVATINTHDTPTFAGFWKTSSHPVWQQLVTFLRQRGLLDGDDLPLDLVYRACLNWLGRSNADLVLVNIEDLWLEQEPQNVPASPPETPNWRRKALHDLDTIESMDDVRAALQALAAARASGVRKRTGPATQV